jgi:hypothetical protein
MTIIQYYQAFYNLSRFTFLNKKSLKTILDVYNCFTCIVSLYRNDLTPRKIDRWLVFQTLYIYTVKYFVIYIQGYGHGA